jgi:hypothetical protein
VAAVAALLSAGPAPVARAAAGWSRPVVLGPPALSVLTAPRLSLASSGAALVGWTAADPDNVTNLVPFVDGVAPGAVRGRVRQLAADRQVLASSPDHDAFVVLTGDGPGRVCCPLVGAVTLTGAAAPVSAQTLVGGLSSAAQAQLLRTADGGLLAVIATASAVYADAAPAGGRFAGKVRLSRPGAQVAAMAATILGGGRSAVAWTEANQGAGTAPARSIYVVYGQPGLSPHGRRVTALTVPAGRRIDELALASAPSGAPTAAWIESWTDLLGRFHSLAMEADLSRTPRPVQLSGSAVLASGIAIASDGAGHELVAFKECDAVGNACAVRATARGGGGSFGAAARLGSIDPSAAPALAVAPEPAGLASVSGGSRRQASAAPAGAAIVAWTHSGAVLSASGSSAGGRFGSPVRLSRAGASGDPAVAVNASGGAFAAWSQGEGPVRIVATRRQAG